MLDKTSLLIGVLFMIAAQFSTWFQLNSQFVWPWAKNHPWLFIILPSIPISIFYYFATKHIAAGFGDLLWPGRFISFGIGIIIFTGLVWWLKNEPITMKTAVSLLLALGLITIQAFWK